MGQEQYACSAMCSATFSTSSTEGCPPSSHGDLAGLHYNPLESRPIHFLGATRQLSRDIAAHLNRFKRRATGPSLKETSTVLKASTCKDAICALPGQLTSALRLHTCWPTKAAQQQINLVQLLHGVHSLTWSNHGSGIGLE